MRVTQAKQWRKRVYVGYIDGRPDYRMIDTGLGGWGNGGYCTTIIVFTDKARAQQEYEDVRPMELSEVLHAPETDGDRIARLEEALRLAKKDKPK